MFLVCRHRPVCQHYIPISTFCILRSDRFWQRTSGASTSAYRAYRPSIHFHGSVACLRFRGRHCRTQSVKHWHLGCSSMSDSIINQFLTWCRVPHLWLYSWTRRSGMATPTPRSLHQVPPKTNICKLAFPIWSYWTTIHSIVSSK